MPFILNIKTRTRLNITFKLICGLKSAEKMLKSICVDNFSADAAAA